MTTQLATFNRALEVLGEASPLANIGEASTREAGRRLLTAWDDTVQFCLEQGQWNFAIRSSSLTYDPGITTEYGLRYGYDLPADFVRWAAVSLDEYNQVYCTDYKFEGGRLYSDSAEIFVRYVSDEADYGLNLSAWPEVFKDYVAHELAHRLALPLGRSESAQDRLEVKRDKALFNAQNKDAMQEAVKTPRRTSVMMARSRSAISRGR